MKTCVELGIKLIFWTFDEMFFTNIYSGWKMVKYRSSNNFLRFLFFFENFSFGLWFFFLIFNNLSDYFLLLENFLISSFSNNFSILIVSSIFNSLNIVQFLNVFHLKKKCFFSFLAFFENVYKILIFEQFFYFWSIFDFS